MAGLALCSCIRFPGSLSFFTGGTVETAGKNADV